MSKYKAAKVIGITGKILLHWKRSENLILQLLVRQKKDSRGRPAKLLDLEGGLHERF